VSATDTILRSDSKKPVPQLSNRENSEKEINPSLSPNKGGTKKPVSRSHSWGIPWYHD
jgi:hypothetical protein